MNGNRNGFPKIIKALDNSSLYGIVVGETRSNYYEVIPVCSKYRGLEYFNMGSSYSPHADELEMIQCSLGKQITSIDKRSKCIKIAGNIDYSLDPISRDLLQDIEQKRTLSVYVKDIFYKDNGVKHSNDDARKNLTENHGLKDLILLAQIGGFNILRDLSETSFNQKEFRTGSPLFKDAFSCEGVYSATLYKIKNEK